MYGLQEGYSLSEIIEFVVCEYVYFLQEKWQAHKILRTNFNNLLFLIHMCFNM